MRLQTCTASRRVVHHLVPSVRAQTDIVRLFVPFVRFAIGRSPPRAMLYYQASPVQREAVRRPSGALAGRGLRPPCYAIPSILLNLFRSNSFSMVMMPDHSRRALAQASGNALPQDQVGVQEPSSFCEAIS